MHPRERDRIPTVVIYHGSRPFSVQCEGKYFDFNYCKRDGLIYYHCSGGGPFLLRQLAPQYAFPQESVEDVRFWTRKDVVLVDEQDHPVVDSVARGYRLLKRHRGNPFRRDDVIEESTIYCTKCDDDLPDDRDEPCEHIWYCDACQAQGGALHDPGCRHKRRPRRRS